MAIFLSLWPTSCGRQERVRLPMDLGEAQVEVWRPPGVPAGFTRIRWGSHQERRVATPSHRGKRVPGVVLSRRRRTCVIAVCIGMRSRQNGASCPDGLITQKHASDRFGASPLDATSPQPPSTPRAPRPTGVPSRRRAAIGFGPVRKLTMKELRPKPKTAAANSAI